MTRFRLFLFMLASMALVSGASLSAQGNPDTSSKHVKVVPGPVDLDDASGARVKTIPAPVQVGSASPFAINGQAGTARSIQVLPEAQMTRNDLDLLANAESSIQEEAGMENLEFNEGGWTYHQLVCPALPNHLFLRFTRDSGTQQMSMFSAAIPRNGDGRVRIIPIVRKGYSLFSPAPIAALTIAAFNKIRAEENTELPADWLGTGLCYAALAGANPQAAVSDPGSGEDEDGASDLAGTMAPSLAVKSNGGATIRFVDVSATPRPMQWSIFFDPRGKLLKATHAPAIMPRAPTHPVPAQVLSEAH
jgi:hypothetical protein